MLTPAPRQTGVSLLELMVGLAVLALLLFAGLPNFRDWMQNTQIRTLAESVLNGLQLARAEAVKRNTRVSFALNGTSWMVSVVNTGETIQTRSAQEGTANAAVAVAPADTTSVTFNGLGRTTAGTNVVFSVTNPAGGACQPAGPMRCLNVEAPIGGQVRMCDPILPVTDPRAC